MKTAKYYGNQNKKLGQEDILSLCKHLDYCGWVKSKYEVVSNWKMMCTNWNMWNKSKIKMKTRPEYEKLMFK